MHHVRKTLSARKKDWKYDFYKTNDNFSRPVQEQMEEFPHNNRKYNIQFLEKNLKGRCKNIFISALKFPVKGLG